VFQDPSVFMQQLLTQQLPVTAGAYKHETDCMHHVTHHIYCS